MTRRFSTTWEWSSCAGLGAPEGARCRISTSREPWASTRFSILVTPIGSMAMWQRPFTGCAKRCAAILPIMPRTTCWASRSGRQRDAKAREKDLASGCRRCTSSGRRSTAVPCRAGSSGSGPSLACERPSRGERDRGGGAARPAASSPRFISMPPGGPTRPNATPKRSQSSGAPSTSHPTTTRRICCSAASTCAAAECRCDRRIEDLDLERRRVAARLALADAYEKAAMTNEARTELQMILCATARTRKRGNGSIDSRPLRKTRERFVLCSISAC